MSYGGGYGAGGGGYGQSNPYGQQQQSNPYSGGGAPAPTGGRYGGQPDLEMQSYDAPQPAGRYGNAGGGLPPGPKGGRQGGGLPQGPGPAGRVGASAPSQAPYPTGSDGYDSNDNLTGNYGGGGGDGRTGGGYSDDGGADILNQCSAIDRTIDELEERLQGLQGLHSRVLNDRAANAEVDRTNSEIMGAYRALGDRFKKVKSNPESGSPRNAPQVGRVDRRLKKAINDYQRVESDFRRQMQEQQARQYRIVRPDASEEEVREAVEDPNTQVFQQALLTSDRRGQSSTTLNAVRQRHTEIQRIEQTIIELAQLFQDLDVIVMEQEPLVANIEQKGEEIQENMVKANEQLDMGVKSARGARKKKWICFWIVIVLIVVIAIAVGAYIAVNKPFSKKDPQPATATVTAAPKPAAAAVRARVRRMERGMLLE